MMHQSPDAEPTFGYLSVLETPEHGHFGGYLIVSRLGRPLEFHCTAPVLPSRAQQILYGPTLRTYLMGEQIAGCLVGAARLTPVLILTDQADAVGVGNQCDVPLVLLRAKNVRQKDATTVGTDSGDEASASGESARAAAVVPWAWSAPFTVCDYEAQLPYHQEPERQGVVELLTLLSARVELDEPFGRIHEAIREAQRIGGRDHEAHGQAA